MSNTNDTFELSLKGQQLSVQKIDMPKQVLFRAHFPDGTPPLVLLRANDFNGAKFWTSMPEGRQSEAEIIGILIEEYFRSKL